MPKWFWIGCAVGVGLLLLNPAPLHAWTPGTHVFIAESILGHVELLPALVGDLLRAFPYDYLYGSIAADTSFAKKYAPRGRHPHAWHVAQEIHDHAESDALRAFGLGYLSHLAADVVAHNYFVPRQLVQTAGPSGVAHAYWEARVEGTLHRDYTRQALDLIKMDHRPADRLLDQVLSPTLFSIPTNRRMFRGMVRLGDQRTWQQAIRLADDYSRIKLTEEDVGRHLEHSLGAVHDLLSAEDALLRGRDPSGEETLHAARELRRTVLAQGGRDLGRLRMEAERVFGLPVPQPAKRAGSG
ncbi:MAG TPA: zinc dependent phospholipase C family protein [Gemmatimonadales bacterium]|nr:zinc dependent phospholipase C family protein [Gemmatimonadales bacterium]